MSQAKVLKFAIIGTGAVAIHPREKYGGITASPTSSRLQFLS